MPNQVLQTFGIGVVSGAIIALLPGAVFGGMGSANSSQPAQSMQKDNEELARLFAQD